MRTITTSTSTFTYILAGTAVIVVVSLLLAIYLRSRVATKEPPHEKPIEPEPKPEGEGDLLSLLAEALSRNLIDDSMAADIVRRPEGVEEIIRSMLDVYRREDISEEED